MNADEVRRKVVAILVEQIGVDEEEITDDASIQDDLGADSLDAVEIAMSAEEEFGIEIPDDDIEPLSTVKQVVDYLVKRVVK